MSTNCFHCHEALPQVPYTATVNGAEQPFCCPGCVAVAQLVAAAGLDQYYRLRAAPAPRPEPQQEWQAYDRPALLSRVSRQTAQGREVLLHLDGVRCAACSWLLQRLAAGTSGIHSLEVNPATARGRVVWNPAVLNLSQVLATIDGWGYKPTPESGRQRLMVRAREARQALIRLAVAGIGMMQVMMYAVGLYLGEYQGMDTAMRDGLRWFSLMLSIPVLWYAGWPILRNAWAGLRVRRMVMDQPVALALLLAWGMSVWHTVGPLLTRFSGGPAAAVTGDVYFEAVTMFVFFLTVARYVEMRARHRAAATAERMAGVGLVLARRLDAQGVSEQVSAEELQPADRIALTSGDTVAADSVIENGVLAVDESLLSGESEPVQRRVGAMLLAGSRVVSGRAEARVKACGAASSLGHLQQMLAQAEARRPRWSATADRLAGAFIAGVLMLAAAVGGYWYLAAPEQAFSIVLSVLVITCPCALSLAAPAALAAATGQLARRGIFVGGAEALGRLARVRQVLLDKTGTLTRGRFERRAVHCLGDLNQPQALVVAARLLHGSRHPVAQAFADVAPATAGYGDHSGRVADAVTEHTGQGISARIDGHDYRLGRPEFACAHGHWPATDGDESLLALADEHGPVALFTLTDRLRPGAEAAMRELRDAGLALYLLSGDREAPVAAVARRLGLNRWRAQQLPQDKMQVAQELQRQGGMLAMVGDGMNDAPVLAAADVSIALAEGAAIPKTRADVVLAGNDLRQLSDVIRSARHTERIVRQNLLWALTYNVLAVPAAAMGVVPPWLAALGMSFSSLVVVLNATRAGRLPATNHRTTASTLPPVPIRGANG